MRVICCQLAPEVGELERNLEMASAAIDAATRAGGDVIVLPELVTSGYCFDSITEARSLAMGPDHPVFSRWATGPVVVAGFAELGDDGALYNSAVLLDGTGVRAVYRKTHLWDAEKLYFRPGQDPPPVIDTAIGRIGMMVCYDMEFPEMTRSVAVRGADLLAVPTNWPWSDHPAALPAAEVVIAMAAARVNRMPIACCDRRGTERGQPWQEATTIIGAHGWPLASAAESAMAWADVDVADGRDKQISGRNHLLGDRRPDLY